MIPVNKAVVVKLTKGKSRFEILVDPAQAESVQKKLKKGTDVDLYDVLAVEDVFVDSRKGLRASKKELQVAFDTNDAVEAAKIILKNGTIHTTSKQRDDKKHALWDKIVALLSMNAMDGKTKKPIPQSVVEDALLASKFKPDNRKVEDQLPDAVKAVKKIIPLTFHEKSFELQNIDAKFAKKCVALCNTLGRTEKEKWARDGSVTAVAIVPAGKREELMDRLNELTRGKINIKLLD